MPHPAINTGLRPWPEDDDNELIGYKLDTRSRPAWKTVGQRMRRTADSRKARWQRLKNSHPDLVTRTDNDAEDKPRMSDKKDACFSSFHYSPFPSWLQVTCSLLRPYFRFGPCWLIVPSSLR